MVALTLKTNTRNIRNVLWNGHHLQEETEIQKSLVLKIHPLEILHFFYLGQVGINVQDCRSKFKVEKFIFLHSIQCLLPFTLI